MLGRVMVLMVLSSVALLAWGVFAQQEPPGQLEEVTGVITGTDRRGDEFSIRVRSLEKTYNVQIGSHEFLQKQNLMLETGELVTVKGRISGDTVTAHEVRKGNQIVTLRNPQGDPVWAGQVPAPGAPQVPVDPNRVVLRGTITNLEKSDGNVIATIQTEANEPVRINLGPDSFLNERSIHLAQGGMLQVQAIRQPSEGVPLYRATEIHHEGKVTALQVQPTDEFAFLQVKPLGPWAADSDYNRQYQAGGQVQVIGTLTDVVQFSLAPDAEPGVALILNAAQGPVTCHLGPNWYISHQGMAFKKGDSITCTGSMINFQGQNVLLVGQLARGNESLMIRDPQGMPCYAAYRKVGQ